MNGDHWTYNPTVTIYCTTVLDLGSSLPDAPCHKTWWQPHVWLGPLQRQQVPSQSETLADLDKGKTTLTLEHSLSHGISCGSETQKKCTFFSLNECPFQHPEGKDACWKYLNQMQPPWMLSQALWTELFGNVSVFIGWKVTACTSAGLGESLKFHQPFFLLA